MSRTSKSTNAKPRPIPGGTPDQLQPKSYRLLKASKRSLERWESEGGSLRQTRRRTLEPDPAAHFRFSQ